MQANKNIARFVRVLDDLDVKAMATGLKRIPGLIMSHPGIGKTSTIEKYCAYRDYNYAQIIPSRNTAEDILGVEVMDRELGRMKRAVPSWYTNLKETSKNGKRTILFIDEISTCDPFIQGPLLNLIFDRALSDEYKLDDNVFIVAAGNYSKDLNCEFKMSSPLVNRFMILNLWIDDIDMDELFDGTFSKLSAEQETEYFGFEAETPEYDYKRFVEWARNEREIMPSRTFKVTEDDDWGMYGFATNRSIEFSLRFAEAYMNTYNDALWMRVCGDTLGTSVKRENKPMRTVFEVNADKYSGGIKEEVRCIAEICGDILKKGVTAELKNELNKAIKDIKNSRELSGQDCRKFNDVAIKYSDSDGDIAYMADTLNKIVSATI